MSDLPKVLPVEEEGFTSLFLRFMEEEEPLSSPVREYHPFEYLHFLLTEKFETNIEDYQTLTSNQEDWQQKYYQAMKKFELETTLLANPSQYLTIVCGEVFSLYKEFRTEINQSTEPYLSSKFNINLLLGRRLSEKTLKFIHENYLHYLSSKRRILLSSLFSTIEPILSFRFKKNPVMCKSHFYLPNKQYPVLSKFFN